MKIEFKTEFGEIITLESSNENIKLSVITGEGILTGYTSATLNSDDTSRLIDSLELLR